MISSERRSSTPRLDKLRAHSRRISDSFRHSIGSGGGDASGPYSAVGDVSSVELASFLASDNKSTAKVSEESLDDDRGQERDRLDRLDSGVGKGLVLG